MNLNQHIKSSYQHFLLTTDKSIRSSLKDRLEKKCHKDSNTRIIEELGIIHGTARVDIAVVNGVIHGYELKSDKDTLDRLPEQIKIFNTALDKITLVVGKTHIHDAIKIIPEWWGITIAKMKSEKSIVSFCNIREPEQNPDLDYVAMAAFLWRKEALNILEELNQAHGVRSKTRNVIYKRLTETLNKQELGERIRVCLRTRTSWRSDLLYIPSGD